MSLAGKTIVVTRDVSQAKPFVSLLEKQGALVILFPTIKLEDSENTELIRDSVKNISKYHWIIFTSAIAIRFYMKHIDSNKLEKLKIACVGNKTAEELSLYNLNADLIPKIFTSENLLKEMKNLDLKDKKVFIPCSSLSNDFLKNGLEKEGAIVEQVVVYKNEPYDNPDKLELQNLIANNKIDCLTFFSPSAVNSFVQIVDDEYIDWIKKQNVPIAVIGSTTEKAVINLRLNPTIKPVESDNGTMVEALVKYFENN